MGEMTEMLSDTSSMFNKLVAMYDEGKVLIAQKPDARATTS